MDCSPLTYVYVLPTCPGKTEELMYRGNNVFHGITKLLLWFRGMLMTDRQNFAIVSFVQVCYCQKERKKVCLILKDTVF